LRRVSTVSAIKEHRRGRTEAVGSFGLTGTIIVPVGSSCNQNTAKRIYQNVHLNTTSLLFLNRTGDAGKNGHDEHLEYVMNSQTDHKSVHKIRAAFVSMLAIIPFWSCGAIAQTQPTKPQTKTEQQQTDGVADANDGQYVGIERAFSRLRFHRPVYLTGAGDGSGRLFVVEHAGIIRWFSQTEENPTNRIFLDISDRVSRRGNEEGLNGFAFHPKFKENGFVYCHYSSEHQRTGDKDVASSIISRFKISNDSNVIDPTSEKILLTIPQPFENHNGGAMQFGNDGYLYFSLGDGGGNNPMGNGQRLSSMHGGINRIDVDSEANGKPYGIPADNPFV